MNNREIAKYSCDFIGGIKPKVNTWYNENNSKKIDIMTIKESKLKNIKVCATIGLNEVNIHQILEDKPITIELIAASYPEENDFLEKIISTVAFEIMDLKRCKYGTILKNIINMYNNNYEMKHILLLTPVFWDNYKSLETSEKIIAWLYLVPISDKELEYINENGIDKFDKMLEEKKVDILEYKRKTCV